MRESRDNIDEYLKNKITKKGSLQIRKKIFHRLTPSHSIPLMPCVSRASQVIVVYCEVNFRRLFGFVLYKFRKSKLQHVSITNTLALCTISNRSPSELFFVFRVTSW